VTEDNDMTLEERVAAMEARYGANDELVREIRDAVTATAHMEARHSRALKDHAEWLVNHDAAIIASRQQQEASRREWETRMKDLDERIAHLVSGFGEFMRRHEAR